MTTLTPYVHEGEVIDGEVAGYVRVLALLNPFTMQRVDRRIVEGQTLEQIVSDLGLTDWRTAWVAIDGREVPPFWWSRVRPTAGHLVTVRAIPRGGGGGGGNKGWIQMIAGIVLIIVGVIVGIAASWTGIGAVIGVGLIFAGAGLVVGGAVSLIFPPPQLPKLKENAADQAVFSITGSRNVANPWGAIPRVLGRHKIFPPFGALPYTEILGNDQYLRELFVVGYGPLALTDLKIGTTPIQNIGGIEVEIRNGHPTDTPLKLFPRDVFEDPYSVALYLQPVRRTRGDVDEWSVDIVWPNGLYHIDGKGQKVSMTAQVFVYYRELGTTPWILVMNQTYEESSQFPIRRSFRFVPPKKATYEIKLDQPEADLNEPSGPGAVVNKAVWGILRSVTYHDPINLPGLCKVAIRIKATDRINGVIDQFNCVATSILPDYDVETDTWITRATRNPASMYREVLQGSANARPHADNRLDLAALQAWHGECVAAGRNYDFIVEQVTTVPELLRQIAAVGRASMGSTDGTFSVVRDLPQTTPVQHFTPRNSRDFNGTKLYRDLPHAIKAKFINPLAEWEIDELIVYDDNHDAGNSNKFESIQFFGVTEADHVYKVARYHFATAKLRPEVYEFVTDVEHIVCTRGDLIRINHDVMLVGLGAGRITAVPIDGNGDATGITMDHAVPMLSDGTRYRVRIRRAIDGTEVAAEVLAVAGSVKALTFVTPIPAATLPAIGDLFMFGVMGEETIDAIVTRIEMLRDLTARITCVDAAPDVHLADTGPIPPHDPHITRPPDLSSLTRPAPIVDDVRSDESVLVRNPDGTFGVRIVVFLHFRSLANSVPAEAIDARYRPTGSQGDWAQISMLVSGDAIQVPIAPVEQGVAYDIRLRSISPRTGQISDWTEVLGYVVVGQSTPPPDVTGLALEGLNLRWAYPIQPVDFAGFKVRRHRGTSPVWGSSAPLHAGVISETSFNLLRPDTGTVTYLVKAVDVSGVESVNAATLSFDHPAFILENPITTIDKKADGWPGTHNGAVIAGNLEADSAGDVFWPAVTTSAFWGADADPFYSQEYSDLSYLTSITLDSTQVPSDIVLNVTVDADAWDLMYRTSGSRPFWGGDSSLFWDREP